MLPVVGEAEPVLRDVPKTEVGVALSGVLKRGEVETRGSKEPAECGSSTEPIEETPVALLALGTLYSGCIVQCECSTNL